MVTGTVKTVNPKGFGFIKCGHGQRDAFFHASDWQGSAEFSEQLIELAVTFDLEDGDRGPRARSVRPQ